MMRAMRRARYLATVRSLFLFGRGTLLQVQCPMRITYPKCVVCKVRYPIGTRCRGLYFPSSKKLEESMKSSKAQKQGDGYDRFRHMPATSVGPPPKDSRYGMCVSSALLSLLSYVDESPRGVVVELVAEGWTIVLLLYCVVRAVLHSLS